MDKPFRLLVVGVNWPPETFLKHLLAGLAQKGIQITLATSRRPDPAWLAQTGIKWFSAPIWRGPVPGTFAYLIYHTVRSWVFASRDARIFWRGLPAAGWKKRFLTWHMLAPFAGRRWDAIYFPWNSAAVHYLPLFDLGMPVVLSCRGSQIKVAPHNAERQDFLPGLRVTLQRAARVHCVSDDILRQAIPLGLDPARALVIRPAVDTAFFAPAQSKPAPNGVFRVVMTGSLVWVKGYEYALSAIYQLAGMGVPVLCTIIGDGPEQARLLFTVQDLGLSGQVQLVGKCSPEQVRETLQRADVFLLSSLSEGISNAVLEAMACGLPVVTTDCGGMREAVTDGVEGFVTPVRDPKSIAQALFDLWKQPELRQRMGQAAREQVLYKFQLAGQVEKWLDLYRDVIRNTRIE